VDQLLNPQIPWTELLRNFLREQVNDDWNFMKPNRLYDEGDFILPSLDSERMGAVVFAKDWSGSVDTDLATVFESEQQGCLDDMKPSRLVDMIFDTEIRKETEYRQGDRIESKAKAGGGTDFRCIFKRCEEMPTPPKCLVVLTDLDGTFPKQEPGYPVLWVVYGGSSEAPFGEVVRVK
jgi:predicted metal-dependent peptidase